MRETTEKQRLTFARAYALVTLPGMVFMLLAWYFDTVWWHDLVQFVQVKMTEFLR